MRGVFFNVDVTSHARGSVDVKVVIPARLKLRGVKVEHEKNGSDAVIRVQGRAGATFLSFRNPSIEISAPSGVALDVGTSSGNISVEGFATREISLSASSGRISIADSASIQSADTSSGIIVVESCDGRKDLSSSSGNIVVRDSDGHIDGKSSSGAQTYEQIAGSIRGSSISGRIDASGTTGAVELSA